MVDIVNSDLKPELNQNLVLDGQTFKEMLTFAVEWFAKSEQEVNALNVFPVPDGDTGTNMLLTMRSSLEDMQLSDANDISRVVSVVARGTLMGARGNSGVILSQIWRGIARSLQTREAILGKDLAAAFQSASQMAYEGLENPVEGTILTVIKEMAAATTQYLDSDNGVIEVLQTAVKAAKKAVANTPHLLPVLKEAGVVDSGGQGLYILFEGSLMYLKGQSSELETGKSRIITTENGFGEIPKLSDIKEEVPYGYCTEFLLKGQGLVTDAVRARLKSEGQSLIVTGDEAMLKIHIHCADPSTVIHYALSLGTISTVSIRNMDEQYADMVKVQKENQTLTAAVAVVTVATGDGIIDTFKKLGASAIIPGGPTMNPSAKQILQAVEAVPSGEIIILPNDKNLILVARKVESLTKKRVQVIPTVSIPQGISAILAFNPEADLQTNLDSMTESKSMVKTIEVTRATRSTRINGFIIKKGQPIGLLDGKLLSVSDSTHEVIINILNQIDLSNAENASLYYGSDIEKMEAEKIRDLMCQKNKMLNIEALYGGQPVYDYIISIE